MDMSLFAGVVSAAIGEPPAAVGLVALLPLIILVIVIASWWKIFTKAGQPGWAAIIPIYNLIVLLDIIGRPVWWIVLFFIPFVNAIVGIIISIDTAKVFGKGIGFAVVGLILFSFIGYPILGFGSAAYSAPARG